VDSAADIEAGADLFLAGTRQFVARGYEEWLRDGKSKLFWVSGGPGMGKSVIMAHLAATQPSVRAAFFCNHRNPDRQSPRRIVASLAYQLATKSEVYREFAMQQVRDRTWHDLGADASVETLWGALFPASLGKLKPPSGGPPKLSLLVDALDESETQGNNDLLRLLAHLGSSLPAWLGVVLSSRPEKHIEDALRRCVPRRILCDQPENVQDLKRYIECKLAQDVGLAACEREAATAALLGKSQGVFLYAKHVFAGCRETLSLEVIQQLPEGLDKFYEDNFQRVLGQPVGSSGRGGAQDPRRLLQVLAAAQRTLNVAELADVLGQSAEHVKEALRPLYGLLSPVAGRQGLPGGAGLIGRDYSDLVLFNHKSILDWLTDGERAHKEHKEHYDWRGHPLHELHHLYISPALGHATLAAACRRTVLVDTHAQAQAVGAAVDVESVVAACSASAAGRAPGAPPECAALHELPPYALQYLPLHAVLARDRERSLVHTVLTDLGFYEAFLRVHPEHVGALLRTLEAALSLAWTEQEQEQARSLRDFWRWALLVLGPCARAGEALAVYPLALLCPDGHAACERARQRLLWWLPRAPSYLRWAWVDKPQTLNAMLLEIKGHSDRVTSVCFSADGSRVASASRDKTVRVWDSASGAQVQEMKGHSDVVSSVCFSADGSRVASASGDNTVRVWDSASGAQVQEDMAVSVQGSQTLSGSRQALTGPCARLCDVYSEAGPRSTVFDDVSSAFYAPSSLGLVLQHRLPEAGVYLAWCLGQGARHTPPAPLLPQALELVLAYVVEYAAQASYLRTLLRGQR
jgi:hypothetical protein